MNLAPTKRLLNWVMVAFLSLAIPFIENRFPGDQLAFAQMALWTVFVFAFMAIQVFQSLWRPRQLCVALSLVLLHFIGLKVFADHFPLSNLLVALVGAGIETVFLVAIYVRVGQSIDPKGPYGLTDAEIRERIVKNSRPK
jgi:hypothetical protein